MMVSLRSISNPLVIAQLLFLLLLVGSCSIDGYISKVRNLCASCIGVATLGKSQAHARWDCYRLRYNQETNPRAAITCQRPLSRRFNDYRHSNIDCVGASSSQICRDHDPSQVHGESQRVTAIIGSTGVLGTAVSARLATLGERIYCGYRDTEKAKILRQRIQESASLDSVEKYENFQLESANDHISIADGAAATAQTIFDSKISQKEKRKLRRSLTSGNNRNEKLTKSSQPLGNVQLFFVDLLDQNKLEIPSFSRCQTARELVLVNAAGVCLAGASPDVLRTSMQVNFIAPTILAITTIDRLTKSCTNDASDGNQPDESSSKSENSNSVGDDRALSALTIINVSSGDGELCFITSEIASRLRVVRSLGELFRLSDELIEDYDYNAEYAYGETPMYSLSKAFLNKATFLLHEKYSSQINSGEVPWNIRVLACCPGNFASPMSTDDELETATPIEKVVDFLIDYINESDNYKSGNFYRNGKQINW